VCPRGALSLSDEGLVVNREKCVACGTCVLECPSDALKISGEVMDEAKVWKTIKRDAVYYETSGGGVTCSGGEILSQPDFVAEIFKHCHDEGIHTCADTSGFGTPEALDKILEHTDLTYFDLKHVNPKRHAELIGVPLDVILSNLKTVVARGIPFVIRVPLIPEYNNSPEELEAMAALVSETAPGASVNILPYHKYGASKYPSVGMVYSLEELRENTPEELETAKTIFESHGLKCEVSK
jgi:pyruvate formate lyase activating enzyme